VIVLCAVVLLYGVTVTFWAGSPPIAISGCIVPDQLPVILIPTTPLPVTSMPGMQAVPVSVE
jgi:hypothetical protein